MQVRICWSKRAKRGTGMLFPAAPLNCLSVTTPLGIILGLIPCNFKISEVVILRSSLTSQNPFDWARVLVSVGDMFFILVIFLFFEPLMSATHVSLSRLTPSSRRLLRTVFKLQRSVWLREAYPIPISAAFFWDTFCVNLLRGAVFTCHGGGD